MKIADLKGLGPATTERLEGVDIGTAERLEVIGAVGAYQLLQRAYPGWVSLNALWGMQAALMEIDWRELPTEIKEQLLDELAELFSGRKSRTAGASFQMIATILALLFLAPFAGEQS